MRRLPETIPYGLCHCGCGRTTTRIPAGRAKGIPRRFISGHNVRHPRIDFSDAAPFKIDEVYCKLIPLMRGQFAIVDANDWTWLSRWPWLAQWSPLMRSFYAVRSERMDSGQYKSTQMHRLIGGGQSGDHKNHVTLDNRRKNIRGCRQIDNGANRQLNRNSSTGYKGVHRNRDAFVATITRNYKRINLGRFNQTEPAARAYDRAAIRIYGEFALLNFPKEDYL